MSTLKVNSIEPANAGSEDYFLARAWVNFNGTGTVAIRADGNVSSITDVGTGIYTVNMQIAMTDSSYAVSFGQQGSSAGQYCDPQEYSGRTTSALPVASMIAAALADTLQFQTMCMR